MTSISLLKGRKEVLQIELSRFFGLKYAFQVIRNIRRVFLRSRLHRTVVLGLLATCIIIYLLLFGQDRIAGTGWLTPETCIASDCRIKQPLEPDQLSPNLLLILIHASANARNVRDTIRKTWLSDVTNKEYSPIQYRFVIGGSDIYLSTKRKILEEDEAFGDILVLPDVTDSLLSLTYRTIKSFKYAHQNFKFSYVLKCDDDSLVDVWRVATELQLRKQRDRLYWGYIHGDVRLEYFGVYKETNWFICDTYTPYSQGGGYVLSKDLVELLTMQEELLSMYRCEDVAVGSWLAPFNIEWKHDSRFNTNTPSRGCKDPYLILHKVSPSDMLYYHNSYKQENKYCSWRTNWYSTSGYLYNWETRLPSQCCYRNPNVP